MVEAEPKTKIESGIGFRISRLARNMRSQWAQNLSELDISPPQAAILRTVVEEDEVGIGIREIARRLGADPMNVKRTTDTLEDRGLISAATASKGQRKRILLTQSGIALARQVEEKVQAQEEEFRKVLTLEQRKILIDSIIALEEHFGISNE